MRKRDKSNPTPLMVRNDMLRVRAKRLLRYFPQRRENGQGSQTKIGAFTVEVARVAEQRGVPLTSGHPSNYTTSMTNWFAGKNYLAFHRLDSIEMTCIELEHKFAMERATRVDEELKARPPVEPSDESVRIAEKRVAMMAMNELDSMPPQEATHVPFEPLVADGIAYALPSATEAPTPADVDSELAAIAQVVHAIEPLDDMARDRVISYACDFVDKRRW